MALRKPLFFNDNIESEEMSSTDSLELSRLSLSGDGGIALDVNNNAIINVAEPASAGDAVNKAYVDNLLAGFDTRTPVLVATTPAIGNINLASAPASIDGIVLSADDRILIKDQTDPKQNGVYVYNIAGSALVRAEDMNGSPSNEIHNGVTVFVDKGTNANSTWTITDSGNPVVIGVDEIYFTQFSGLGTVVAGNGLTKTGSQIDVGKGDGINITADAIELDLDVNPGLQLLGTSPNKKLSALPDGLRGLAKDASGLYLKLATDPGLQFTAGALDALLAPLGGLQKDSAGIAVKIASANELSVDGSGIHVEGVPSEFEIGGLAVSTNVTAGNLNTLTGGGSADGLHTHTAGTATDVPLLQEQWQANGAVSKGSGVYISAADRVSNGDNTNFTKSIIIGVAAANIADSAYGNIVKSGKVTACLTAATPGERYFLGPTNGSPIKASAFAGGAEMVQLGIARNATDLEVQITRVGKKAV